MKHLSFSQQIIKGLSGILFWLLIVLLFIPVLDLPVATSVPLPVWLLLVIADIAIIILLIRFRLTAWGKAVFITGFVIIAALAVAASQMFAATPPITGSNSIAVLEKVELGGTGQWITIRGKDVNKPVLLYLGIGGPGAGGFPATAMNLKPLEDHFVVVNWDQRGTGKSYDPALIPTLEVDQFIRDARELTELMCKRFDREKIYVMGLSWGTILGTKLVHEYPEHYYAYIGTGQMVNTTENDRIGYQLALKVADEKEDKDLYNKLKSYGEPPYTGEGLALKYAAYNNVLFDYMGSYNLQVVLLGAPQFAREYGLMDKFNFARGLIESFAVVYPQLQDLDFTTQAAEMEVPMYFLVGRQDVNAVAALVERYYNILEAPYKELIWLDSGHGASPQDIKDVLVNRVLVKSPPK